MKFFAVTSVNASNAVKRKLQGVKPIQIQKLKKRLSNESGTQTANQLNENVSSTI